MPIQIKKAVRLLNDPRSMIFGLAVFNLILVWLRSPEWRFHRNIFMAVLLLVSSISLLLNTVRSNLIAAVLSGYLPIQIVSEFWMLAHHAEVPVFSYRHLRIFLNNIQLEGGVLLFLALSLMIFARAAVGRGQVLTSSKFHSDLY